MRVRISNRLSRALAAGSLLASLASVAQADDDQGPKEKEPVSAEEAAEKGNLDVTVLFKFDSSALDPAAKASLDELAVWAKENKDRVIVVAGHTDEIGSKAYNLELGERRAQSAREYLISQGVDAATITVVSYGEELPASSSNAKNRRVVFISQAVPEPEAKVEPLPEPRANIVETPAPIPTTEYEPESKDSHLVTPHGMSLVIGGGVADFIDSDTRDTTDTAGTWEARLTYGTRSLFGIEAAYVGSAQGVDALGLDTDAMLLGSAGETALRITVPDLPYIQPYAFGGVGFTNYSLVNDDFNTSSVDGSEWAVHFPLGAGVGFASDGFVFDLRGTYRPMTEDDLFSTNAGDEDGNSAGLDSWSATAHAGFEF